MDKPIKTYNATFKPGTTKGVYGISLVENPAMEGRFLALSKETAEIKLTTIDEDKRILIGLVLEPDKPIYRNQDGEEFNVVFSSDTIKELSYAFYKGGFHQNSSLEHSSKIDGVTFVENWIIEDPKIDKSAALGLSYPKGSWMATMKVDNEDLWNDYVKTGKVTGFSIDALVTLEEVETKNNIKMSDVKSIIEAIKEGFSFAKPKPIHMGSVKSADGSLNVMFDAATLDEVKEGDDVWVEAADGTKVPLPVGEYSVDGDKTLVVTTEGKFSKLTDTMKPAAVPEAPAATTAPVEAAKDNADLTAAIKSIMVKFQEENQKEFKKLNERLAESEKKLLEFGAQPAARPVKAVPAQAVANTAKNRILAAIQEQN